MAVPDCACAKIYCVVAYLSLYLGGCTVCTCCRLVGGKYVTVSS